MQVDVNQYKDEQQKVAVPNGYASLSANEARLRLQEHGENIVFHSKRDQPILAFVKKFNSPLLILLVCASAVSLYVGQYVSSGLIAFMVLMSAVLDFINTYRSERAAEALASKIVTTVHAYRDGKWSEVPLRVVVPGDLILLSAGTVIPADGVLISGDDLFTNQSALTGESFPVGKEPYQGDPGSASSLPTSHDTPYALYMGTSVVTGFGVMLVVRTGQSAEYGSIAARLAEKTDETAFDKGIRQFSFFIMRLAFVMVVAVFIITMVRGNVAPVDSLLFAIAIVVGLTPELLPVIMTVTLSRGSLRMAEKHVVVRHLAAIQNFGAMTVLATDKTGTLTRDKITLVRCIDPWGRESNGVFEAAYLSSIFRTARSSPLDEAVKEHGTLPLEHYTKVDEIPFDFIRKRGSVVYDKGGERVLVTKGAPEELIAACVSVRDQDGERQLDEGARLAALEQYEALSRDGFRVLAVADRRLPVDAVREYKPEAEHELVLLGFAAFYDPPKSTADKAVKELTSLGIAVKIITGDSELLTKRICEEIGIPVKGILTGVELRDMSDDHLAHSAKDITIFARVTPDEKERVVRALRASGEIVGYLGDGINDAPALKAADVGISVNNAVDVAKETADIILLRKGLEVLVDGVREGRITFENTMKYVRMGFSSNFGNMTSMLVASAYLPFLPMLPGQILINNFLYDVSQTALPGDNVDDDAVQKPISWDIGAIRRYMMVFGFVSSVFDILTFFVLYKVFQLMDGAFQTGWFIESIATQVLVVYIIRTKRIPFIQSNPSTGVKMLAFIIIAVALALPYLPFAVHAGFVPLSVGILGVIAGITLTYLLVAEGAKRFYNYLEDKRRVDEAH